MWFCPIVLEGALGYAPQDGLHTDRLDKSCSASRSLTKNKLYHKLYPDRNIHGLSGEMHSQSVIDSKEDKSKSDLPYPEKHSTKMFMGGTIEILQHF